MTVHLALENYATHKAPRARGWLARRSPFHLHFTPTGAGWLNVVERPFAEVTSRCLRRGSYTAVCELEKALVTYLNRRNREAQPFMRVAKADEILAKVARLCKRISKSRH